MRALLKLFAMMWLAVLFFSSNVWTAKQIGSGGEGGSEDEWQISSMPGFTFISAGDDFLWLCAPSNPGCPATQIPAQQPTSMGDFIPEAFCTNCTTQLVCSNDDVWLEQCCTNCDPPCSLLAKEEECGTNEQGTCGAWECSPDGASKLRKRIDVLRGCSNGACYETQQEVVCEQVSCPNGCSNGECIGEGPVADFIWTPADPKPNQTITFDASLSYDPDGTIVSYDWNGDDGILASGITFTHKFPTSGNFKVTLTVTDENDMNASITKTVTVGNVVVNKPPVADFIAEPESGEAPLQVQFDASLSVDADGTIVDYVWSFGDGSTGSGVKVSHTFTSTGFYQVRLTVTDDAGSSSTKEKIIAGGGKASITSFVAENIATGNETKLSLRCTHTGDANVYIRDPNGKLVFEQSNVLCNSILLAGPFDELGLYSATAVLNLDSSECEVCQRGTQFIVYSASQVNTSEINMLALLVLLAVVFYIVREKSRA
jgi:PKD repeat protein